MDKLSDAGRPMGQTFLNLGEIQKERVHEKRKKKNGFKSACGGSLPVPLSAFRVQIGKALFGKRERKLVRKYGGRLFGLRGRMEKFFG